MTCALAAPPATRTRTLSRAMNGDPAADVQAASQGDREAYARLVERHRRTVASIAIGIVGEVAASEDVAQEVFLAVWSGLGTLRDAESFGPWLRGMARNKAHDHARSLARRRLSADGETALAGVPDPGPTAPEALQRNEDARRVDEAFARLSEEDRVALALFYRESSSVAEVAAALGVGEATARKRLSRARARLRKTVRDDLGPALQRTAPGAAFSLRVLAALPPAAPIGGPGGPEGSPEERAHRPRGERPAAGSPAGAEAWIAAGVVLIAGAAAVVSWMGPAGYPEPPAIAVAGTADLSTSGSAAGSPGPAGEEPGARSTATPTRVLPAAQAPVTLDLRGRVESSGEPVAGTTVSVLCRPASERGSPWMISEDEQTRIVTGPGGRFLVKGIEPGSECSLEAKDPLRGRAAIVVDPSAEEAVLDLVLGGAIHGMVLRPDGSPAGGLVGITSDTLVRGTPAVAGAFRFGSVPAGEYEIQALVKGHPLPDAQRIVVADGATTEVHIRLPAGGGSTLRGRAVRPDGRPGTGYTVYFSLPSAMAVMGATGEDGRFEIPGIRGRAQVRVLGALEKEWTRVEERPAGEVIDLGDIPVSREAPPEPTPPPAPPQAPTEGETLILP